MSTDFRISKRRARDEQKRLFAYCCILPNLDSAGDATLQRASSEDRPSDIAQSRCDAIAVSANPLLEGVSRSTHCRFAGRSNADGAVRAAGGASLAAVHSQMRESEAVLEPGKKNSL